MKQFKSLVNDLIVEIKNDLADNEITPSREVYLGLMIQYVENLISNSQDQENFEGGLWQKTINCNVENKKLLLKRCMEIAALANILYEDLNNEYQEVFE